MNIERIKKLLDERNVDSDDPDTLTFVLERHAEATKAGHPDPEKFAADAAWRDLLAGTKHEEWAALGYKPSPRDLLELGQAEFTPEAPKDSRPLPATRDPRELLRRGFAGLETEQPAEQAPTQPSERTRDPRVLYKRGLDALKPEQPAEAAPAEVEPEVRTRDPRTLLSKGFAQEEK